VTFDPGDDFAAGLLLDVDPKSLSPEDLIDLVEDLQRALAARMASPAPAKAPSRQPARAVAGADYTVVFDGGSLGNPGLGYGSYEIVGLQGSLADDQVEFGDGMTNNQAEFHALIAGLNKLLDIVGAKASNLSIAVRGDSQLVIRGLTGEWKVKHPGLVPLHHQARELLGRFRSVDLAWHPRRESVRTFGH
jgi:ribonuclease HI